MQNILQYFNKIQDKRHSKGKRYKLCSILALIFIGYMRGYTSLARIYRFGKTLLKTQAKLLGFASGITPSHPTLTETMRWINVEEFQKLIGQIVQSDPAFEQIALDGKSIRSTNKSTDGLLHLVSAYAVESKGVLAQIKSALAGGEIKAASKLMSKMSIKNKIITGDTMFAQRRLCAQIRNKKAIIYLKLSAINQELLTM